MDAVNGDIRQKPDAKCGLPADIIAECAGEENLPYVGIGDRETMLKEMYPGTDGGLGELDLADVLLGQIHRGSMAMISEDKDRAFLFSRGIFVFYFGYTFRDGRGQGCFGFESAGKINNTGIEHYGDGVDET